MTAETSADGFGARIDRDHYTVVVGVSATSGSPAALRWAYAEGLEHHGPVIAVRAWRPPRPPAAVAARPSVFTFDVAQMHADAQDQLARDVEKVLGRDSGVECRLLHGGRRKVLLAASRAADVLVIDAPRRTDLSSAPMFAQRLIHHAECPVVIMPPALAQQPDTAIVTAGKRIGRGLLNAAGTAGRPGVRAPVTPAGDDLEPTSRR